MSVRSTYRFARVPEWVLLHVELSSTDVRVFGLLDRYDGKECIPALETLAEKLCCSRDTVKASIRHLEAIGALRRETRLTDEGRQTSNRYHLAGDVSFTTGGGNIHPSGSEHTHSSGGGDSHPNPEQEDPEQEEPPSSRAAVALKPLEIIADGRFDLFWEAYPRKVDRKKCLRMFDKLMRTVDHEDIMDGLGRWILYWQRRGDPEFIPHPYTWLYNERWTEQPPSNGEKRSAVGNKMREMYAEAIEAEGR